MLAAKVMKRWIISSKSAAFVVEHDFIMATYMADKVLCFEGTPAQDTKCCAPESLITGMNRFLCMMEITFRRDPTNYRPRINKYKSIKDQEQKASGNYFLMDEEKLTKEEEAEEADAAAASKSSKPAGGAKKEKKGKSKD